MLSTIDIENLYETILSIPGMNDIVKIDMKLSRKNVLLLNKVIERGLSNTVNDNSAGILHIVPQETLEQLSAVAAYCLQKAELKELNEKLNSFTTVETKQK